MNMFHIFEYFHRGVKFKLNRNGNRCSFFNKRLPLSSSIECEKGARYQIQGVSLRPGCCFRIRKGATLNIGNNVAFNNNCVLTCRDGITIGDNTNIGPNCSIFDHDHDYASGDRFNHFKTGSIKIGKNVWIGANVSILKGSVIGDNCVVGAGSVVKGHFDCNTLIVGNPAIAKKKI